jgi:formyl-CoA transferase
MMALTKWLDSEGMASEFLKQIDWTKVDLQTVSQDLIDKAVAEYARFFLTRTKAELFEEADKRGIHLYPLFTPEDMLKFAQLIARNYWVEVEHPEIGEKVTYPGSYAQTSEAPYRIFNRAPLIGEHNKEIYTGELGLSEKEFLTLKQTKVI